MPTAPAAAPAPLARSSAPAPRPAAAPARARRRRLAAVLAGSGALLLAAAALQLSQGVPDVGVGRIVGLVVSGGDGTEALLVRDVRLPRVLVAVAAGAALGLAGTLLQDALRNPLADPSLLGVAQGASLAVAVATVFPSLLPVGHRPLLCLLAGGAAGLVVAAAGHGVRDPGRVVLAGAVLSTLFATLTSAVVLLAPTASSSGLAGFARFVAGSASAATWDDLRTAAPWLLVGVPAALLCGRVLNLLGLGDDVAASAGVDPARTRLAVVAIALVLVAPATAIVGPVAFVALFAPHLARNLLGSGDARAVLPCSAVLGALVLLVADVAGRLALFPSEVPAGVWTVAVVGPLAVALHARLGARSASPPA